MRVHRVEVRIWWDYDEYNPRHPWCYEVAYLDSEASGRAMSMTDAYNIAYALFLLPGTITQDNNTSIH